MADPDLYRTKEEIARWRERDPIETFASKLRQWRILTDSGLAEIERAIESEIKEAVKFADSAPWEPVDDLLKDVYSGASSKSLESS